MGFAEHSKAETSTVRSADGTRIGFARVGSGPVPMVIVHGAFSSGENWREVAAAMSEHCTCYLMDRWGRGGSDEHTAYSLDREVEDILAVLDVAGPDAYLLGHSSGAIYALEAALQHPVAGLVLYEPPLNAFHGRFIKDVLPRMREAAQAERFDEVVTLFLHDELRIPDDKLSNLKATPLWGQMVVLAPHTIRELEELANVGLTPERYRDVRLPTLLLTGTLTKDHPSFAPRVLESTLPDTRTVMLDGQGHVANLLAPDLVAKEAIAFIRETSR